jgi:hypothetical protein
MSFHDFVYYILLEMKLMCIMGKEIPVLKSRGQRLEKEAAHLASLERSQQKEAKKASKKR